jgi:hypothetical protein
MMRPNLRSATGNRKKIMLPADARITGPHGAARQIQGSAVSGCIAALARLPCAGDTRVRE